MKAVWRFEALDMLAGIAFASYSGPDVAAEELIALRPPAFDPVPLGRASLGLSATRAYCQAGLMVGDQEATFPNLDSLREFVRRSYIYGSGSGNGPAGTPNGGPPPESPRNPMPPNENQDQPEGNGRIDGLDALVSDLQKFSDISSNLLLGESDEVQWKISQPSSPAGKFEMLLRGAALCLRDEIRLVPMPGDGLLVSSLVQMLCIRIGFDHWDQLYFIEEFFEMSSEFSKDELQRLRNPRDVPTNWSKMDVIANLPAPTASGQPRPASNLLEWFTRFLATPIEAINSTGAYDVCARAVFISAILVTNSNPAVRHYPYSMDKVRTHLDMLAEEALHWLERQLPRHVFSSVYENAIATALQRW